MSKIVTRKEYDRRRVRLQVAAGFFDFLVTIACFALAVLCIYLLLELYAWLKGDIPFTFGEFFEIARKALNINKG